MSVLTAYDKFIQQALKYGFSLFGLPKTGQTIEYRSGDNGTYETGYPQSGSRFTDNGDGTISDSATGLMWAKDGTGLGCKGGVATNWNNTIDWALSLDFAGHTDWRVPNIKELISILDYSLYNKTIDPIFTNTIANFYWSSSTYKNNTGQAWTVDFLSGYSYFSNKFISCAVRAVRG